jgi:hypothetical protein
MTLDQQEPSANSPCTKTTFSVFVDVWARWQRDQTREKRPQRRRPRSMSVGSS